MTEILKKLPAVVAFIGAACIALYADSRDAYLLAAFLIVAGCVSS